MRLWLLIAMLVLPLSGCMTQRDKTIWAEFKAEISDDKAEVKADEAEKPKADESPAPAE